MYDHTTIRITDDKVFIDTITKEIDKKQDVLDILYEHPLKTVIFDDICYNLRELYPIMNVLWEKSDEETLISITESKKNDSIIEDEIYINKLNIYYLFPQYLDFLQKKYKIYFNLEIIYEIGRAHV